MKGLAVIALVGLATIGLFALHVNIAPTEAENQFASYVAEYQRSYTSQAEYEMRMKIFTDNLKVIEEHNAKGLSWQLGVTPFADWTQEEFKRLLGYRPVNQEVERVDPEFNGVRATSKDWVKDGAVNPVQNQGSCGSCWAFGSIGAVEGAYFVKTGKLLKFSEQELVDCCHDRCAGCNGGFQNNAMGYLKTHQICLESEYSYTAKDGSCKETTCSQMGKTGIVSNVVIMKQSADALTAALNIVPVSVTVDASKWSLYKSGIYDNAACGTGLNHAVLGTGYGTENGVGYFTIKNSWTTGWGEKGFIRVKNITGNKGICGSYMDNSYAVAK